MDSIGGMECFDAFVKRCSSAFLEIVNRNISTSDHLYFVLHGGTIMAICHDLSEPHKDYFNWHIKCGDKLDFALNSIFKVKLSSEELNALMLPLCDCTILAASERPIPKLLE